MKNKTAFEQFQEEGLSVARFSISGILIGLFWIVSVLATMVLWLANKAAEPFPKLVGLLPKPDVAVIRKSRITEISGDETISATVAHETAIRTVKQLMGWNESEARQAVNRAVSELGNSAPEDQLALKAMAKA